MSAAPVRERTAGVPGAPGARDSRRGMVALARVEAVRLLRHPVTVVFMLLFMGTWIYDVAANGAARYPVLQDENREIQFAGVVLLGGAALVVANLAVLRAHRHGTAALYDVLALPAPWRTGGHLLALVPFAAVSAGLVAVRIGVFAASPGAAGATDPYELATTPVAVLLLGATGVLLGRLVHSVVVAPLVLLALAVVTVAGQMPGYAPLAWILPAAVSYEPMPLPVDLLARPAAAHLVYLAGALSLVIVAALARSGARGRYLTAVAAAGLLVTLAAGAVQYRPVNAEVTAARIVATERPAGQQTCRTVDPVTYCAFEGFTPWVSGWDTVVRGVLRRLPAAEAQRPFAVRQRVWAHNYPTAGRVTELEDVRARAEIWRQDDQAAGTPATVPVGTTWGDLRSEVGFAGLIAYEVLTRAGVAASGSMCGSRAVLVAWLAGQATPRTAAGLREADATSWGGVSFTETSFDTGVSVPDREMSVAFALLERPADQIGAQLLRSWPELTAAGTPTERVGELFGVPVPPQLPEGERSVCTA
ncbi:hypothetical protein [Paractinoplanes rishiriensis]|uniref:Uncharacterized protein n=1 Tax=Paractinoplanes rishiriensis TaxID=1050105 RepID=A0A919K6I0_9ACTN|nr:hypothetical protein [Actinoplanes rishiriensis]GIF00545.1 hypothetical protein Ari01nite_80090 [Actinoplanes rishiriensis]